MTENINGDPRPTPSADAGEPCLPNYMWIGLLVTAFLGGTMYGSFEQERGDKAVVRIILDERKATELADDATAIWHGVNLCLEAHGEPTMAPQP